MCLVTYSETKLINERRSLTDKWELLLQESLS